MRRGLFLFLLSLFIILLILELWFVVQDPGSTSAPASVTLLPSVDSLKARKHAEAERDSSQPPTVIESFAYLGRVKSPEQASTRKTTGSPESTNRKLPAGRNRAGEGEIPELTIDLGSRNINTVARRLGFLLVAASQEKVLGKIVDDTFTSIGKPELARFSTRARSAEMVENYDDMRERIAQQFSLSPDEVTLMFLVPLNVEQQFIKTQFRTLKEIKVAPAQVALMRGFYDSNFNVHISEVITKDGRTIDIQ